MAASGARVLVVGLDGVPFELLEAWAGQGVMPNLGRLIRDGASGPLASTMPPTSGPAWSSFVTGKNPGKTGIYDFLYRRPDGYVFPPVNASMRSGSSIWKILSEQGRRVCALNLPIAYPVEPVNGALVSGWMTPYFATDYTYPPELAQEIAREVGDYRIYPSETFAESRKDAFFSASDELLEMLTATSLHLLRRERWDLFMTVYFDTDRMLHQLWHYLDPDHPWRAGGGGGTAGDDLSAPVKAYFSKVDADIGRLVAEAGPDARVMVMSDHGMGRASRFVVLNNLLLRTGLMKMRRDPASLAKQLAFKAGVTLRNVHRVADALGLAKHAEYKNVYSFDALLKRVFLSFNNIDWSRTKAYSFGRHYGSVFINLAGREPQGSVDPADYERVRDELAETLLGWTDPELGRPLVSQVLRREDVYHGRRYEEAPDLILLPEDPADIFFGLSDFGSNRVWDRTYRYSGMHRAEGSLIARGPELLPGTRVKGAAIVDLAPTLLHWLDHGVPEDMDGRVLTEMMSAASLESQPVRIAAASDVDSPSGPEDYDEREAREVMERLRDLGYLG